MDWLAFTYSLPTRGRSSLRVTLWRRLRRLGAVAIPGGTQVLPMREDCREALAWLAQEIQHADGQAIAMHVTGFVGMTDEQLIAHFRSNRGAEYEALSKEVLALEQAVQSGQRTKARNALARLRRRYTEIARIDYFSSSGGTMVASALARIEQALAHSSVPLPPSPQLQIDAYRGRRWVTRPHPHVDRLACIWLIRTFIDSDAVIRYATHVEEEETPFDMEGADLSHRGPHCTFEVFLQAFGLVEPALLVMAEIVHEIDLHDGAYSHPDVAGVERVLEGWANSGLADAEIEQRGVALFDGLYHAFAPKSDG